MTPIDAIDHCLSTIDETDAPDLVAALRSAIELLPAEGAQGDRRRRPGPVAPSRRPRPAPSGVADAVAGVRRSGREAW